ncbi:MAG: hypothetical protein O7A08_12000 [SAR324 cluster bacterium]|nr:hypothetical protein [SAR324 cluster bacterium]MCZ6533673.1 hypothetical protein [SAR324 cluster bacterium]MCZ6841252.1 hypothetical protein [SAR324 cluster bacterium]
MSIRFGIALLVIAAALAYALFKARRPPGGGSAQGNSGGADVEQSRD